jgi:hypothetical protein
MRKIYDQLQVLKCGTKQLYIHKTESAAIRRTFAYTLPIASAIYLIYTTLHNLDLVLSSGKSYLYPTVFSQLH